MGLKDKITPSRVILAVLVLVTLAALIFSGRPWRGYSMPRVAEIALLPDNDRMAQVRRYTEIGSGIFPYLDGVMRPELGRERQPLHLGYAYDEYGILGMPYWVGGEYGLVTYLETAQGIQVAAITEGQRPLLDEMVGRPVTRDYSFRWYFQIWGWLFPPLLILWLLAWRREDQAEEERLMNS
jgi:hypothetical protein